jgi:hypothetical protein
MKELFYLTYHSEVNFKYSLCLFIIFFMQISIVNVCIIQYKSVFINLSSVNYLSTKYLFAKDSIFNIYIYYNLSMYLYQI